MQQKRVHQGWFLWAEKAVGRVAETAAHVLSDLRADTSVAEDADAHVPPRIAKWLQELAMGDVSSLQDVTQWIEAHGEEAWLTLMRQWERLSRELVDDMLQTPSKRRTMTDSSMLRAWDRAARTITETLVDAMMETGSRKKRAPKMRSSSETSEIHEYGGVDDSTVD